MTALDTEDHSALSNQTSDDRYMLSLMKNITSKENSTENTWFLYSNETSLHQNTSSVTFHEEDWKKFTKLLLDILIFLVLIITMLAMGCQITCSSIIGHIKRPVGFCIGVFCQFVVMPLCAFCLLLITGVQGLQAVGVLILSCCPGGTLSNLFTYFCDGDTTLSVAMTTCSVLFAMFMMPLNLWLYGKQFETTTLVIPYTKMALSPIITTSPVIVGMLVRWKLPRIAAALTRFGTVFSLFVVISTSYLEVVLFPNMFDAVPLKLYVLIAALPFIGITFGYGVASLFHQNRAVRKTIAIETGIQNIPLAFAVTTLSFSVEVLEKIALFTWLYLLAMTSSCTIVCLAYYLHKRYCNRKDESLKRNIDDVNKDPLLKDHELHHSDNKKIKIISAECEKQLCEEHKC